MQSSWNSQGPSSDRPWDAPAFPRKPFPLKTVTIILAVVAALALFGPLLIIGLFSLVAGEPTGTPTPPPYPVVAGVRVNQDQLVVFIGHSCPTDAYLYFDFTDQSSYSSGLYVKAKTNVSQIDIDQPGANFDIGQALDVGFDWHDTSLTVSTRLAYPLRGLTAASLDLSGLPAASAQHSPNEFYFGNFGWLTPEEVAARDGVDLLTVCSPP